MLSHGKILKFAPVTDDSFRQNLRLDKMKAHLSINVTIGCYIVTGLKYNHMIQTSLYTFYNFIGWIEFLTGLYIATSLFSNRS